MAIVCAKDEAVTDPSHLHRDGRRGSDRSWLSGPKLVEAKSSQMGTTVMWKRLLIPGIAIGALGGHAQTVPGQDPSTSSYLPVVEEDSQTVLARTSGARA